MLNPNRQYSRTEAQEERQHIEVSEFRDLLETRRQEILGRVSSTQSQIDEQLAQSGGPGDEADSSVIDTSADYFLKLADQQRKELLQIQDALVRLQRGTYGICQNCQNEIAVERLRKLPYARLCIDCQSALEQKEKSRRLQILPKI